MRRLTAKAPSAGGARKHNEQHNQDEHSDGHNDAHNGSDIQAAARRLAGRTDAHLVVCGAQLIARAQIVCLGCVLQSEPSNGQRHVVLIVANVLWLVGRVACVAATLLNDGAIDGPLDSWWRAGPDGNVHDGSVLQVEAVHRGFGLVNWGIYRERRSILIMVKLYKLYSKFLSHLHRTLMM